MNANVSKIKQAGLKVTPQRLAIYDYLVNTDCHPSADTIYKNLEETTPGMSLATVYKTLEAFKKNNLVIELNAGDGFARYDAITENHSHLVCTNCGRVYDLFLPETMNIREQISNLTNFKLNDERLIFYGVCPSCQADEE